jgi:hypothetical protein
MPNDEGLQIAAKVIRRLVEVGSKAKRQTDAAASG